MEFHPHEYQKIVMRHIESHEGSGVFLGMGLGKTSIVLATIMREMYDEFRISKVLIIAPKRVAESTWQDEAAKWDCFQCLTFSSVLGSKKNRIAALHQPADIYVTNRENVKWLMEYLGWNPDFDMLILDESSSFKDASTMRWKALRKVRSRFKQIVLLTGTPRPNSLMDLWAQLYLIDGGVRLGRTLTEYRNNYFLPDKRNGMTVFSYKIRDDRAEREIYKRISDVCISLKADDYKDIPDKLPPVIVKVHLDDQSKARYRELERECVTEIEGNEITALSAAAVSNKLLQLANGAVYDNDGKAIEVHSAKIDALKEIVDECNGNSVLVFYSYKSDLERIKRAFPYAKSLDSADDIRDWNSGKIRMLLAHPASAGYGLNLQAGGHIIVWFGLTWSLEQYQQANARLERQGQTDPVIIHHLVAEGTMDENVMSALARKNIGQKAMMDAVKLKIQEVAYDRARSS